MINKKHYKVEDFLKLRSDRYNPVEAEKLQLKRLDKIDFSGAMHISEASPTRTGMILIKKGDLVISGINVEKGALAVYEGSEDILATIHYSSYSYNPKIIDLKYFKLFLKSKVFKNKIKEQTKGGIKTEIKPKSFLPIEIDLPDVTTQNILAKKIVYKLQTVSKCLDINKTNKVLLKKLKDRILDEAMRGKLVPQDPSEESSQNLLPKIKAEIKKQSKGKSIKEEISNSENTEVNKTYIIPNTWIWTKLSEICFQITDGSHFTPTYVDKGIPFLSVKNLSGGEMNFTNTKYISQQEHDEFKKRCNPEYMDLLLTKVGTTGIAKLVDVKKEFSIFVSVALLKYPQKYIYPKYFEYLINSPLVKSMSKAGTEGIGNKNLVLRKIKNFIIPIPPYQEQIRIAHKIDFIFDKLKIMERNLIDIIKNSELLFESVLQEAFN